jgi:hypothetical protein
MKFTLKSLFSLKFAGSDVCSAGWRRQVRFFYYEIAVFYYKMAVFCMKWQFLGSF